ncbi:hypothetical protein FJZ53_07395 [Candidatus Woesearchaeota archaeon]|nr:hypothetical protein [Candidatus Woesearchaeota archaeon]
MAKKGIDKLVKHLEKEGIKVNKDVKKVLNYFDGKVVTYFRPSGFGSNSPDLVRHISDSLGMKYEKIEDILWSLESKGFLATEKGMHAISGSEYEYGFSEKAKSTYK